MYLPEKHKDIKNYTEVIVSISFLNLFDRLFNHIDVFFNVFFNTDLRPE